MENLGYVNSFFKVLGYSLLPQDKKEEVTNRRLHELVRYVKEKSPYFAKAYADIGDDFVLQDLPVTNKKIMRQNFDTWHTVPGIRLDDVMAFIQDKSNIGKLYQGKYTIIMTSGSTGNPAIILQDSSIQNLAGVMAELRAMKFQFPMVNICDNTGYGIDNESIRHNKGKASILNKLVSVVNSKQPEAGIVADLERVKPRVMFGYTGVLSLIANEALAGRLHIKPKMIFTSGEYMSDGVRQKIREAFPTAKVHSVYGCTEGGAMAYECRCDHFHLNEDWTILESVDKDNHPVPYGQPGARLLLTNLSNWLQPLIRYEMGDKAILHKNDCPCGRKGVWVEVDGRANADLKFETPHGTVLVPSMVLFEIFEGINDSGMSNFDQYQLILKPDQRMELRLHCFDGVDPEKMLKIVQKEVGEYLEKCGVYQSEIYLSEKLPAANTRTGKVICVYQEKAEVHSKTLK